MVFHHITMDILAKEKAMLEVKQYSNLVLLPNSITTSPDPDDGGDLVPIPHPLATHRITLTGYQVCQHHVLCHGYHGEPPGLCHHCRSRIFTLFVFIVFIVSVSDLP